MRTLLYYLLPYVVLWALPLAAQKPITLDFDPVEIQQRRIRAMQALPNGLLLFPANTRIKSYEQHGFIQNTAFYYLTGLGNSIGAVLVLDAKRGKSILFAPSTIGLDGMEENALVPINNASMNYLKLDSLMPIERFNDYLEQRLSNDTSLAVFASHQNEGIRFQNYSVMHDPWIEHLQHKFPGRRFGDPAPALNQQEIKSVSEINALRKAGLNARNALIRALQAVKPGIGSREVEGTIVLECTCNEGNGIYFWPLVVQGKKAEYPGFFNVFTDYKNASEKLTAGNLARIDLGCDFNHYKSDVGRTVPVSGSFTDEQREVYDLLVHGYLAALNTFKDGTTLKSIFTTFFEEVQQHKDDLKTPMGKKAFELLTGPNGMRSFQVHEMGLGATEKQVLQLKEGMVVAWEPMFTVGDQSYYLEDLILITKNGYENLTPGLPYYATDIEKQMKKRNKR